MLQRYVVDCVSIKNLCKIKLMNFLSLINCDHNVMKKDPIVLGNLPTKLKMLP